jgi:tripeptide aminopeptidase
MESYAIFADPRVRRARARLQEIDQETLDEQVRIACIAAPTNDEGARAHHLVHRLDELGVRDVHRDEVGNVLGWIGRGCAENDPPLAISAHLDTVFPADTVLRPVWTGDRIELPGITDNARGLAALVSLVRVVQELDLVPARPVLVACTVGEEGRGDLRGMKHLFRPKGPAAGAIGSISLDGTGLRRIVHRGVGSRRFRVLFTGPGGHSWADWGLANPAHAVGVAVHRLRELVLPSRPRTTLTVARIGGGNSVNAIPEEAWLELDLRSESASTLHQIERAARHALESALADENERRSGGALLDLRVEVIGDRPAGETPGDEPLVHAAVAATRAVAARPALAGSSTDANVPMSLGIPAVTLGAGGESGGTHTLAEWYRNVRGATGVERALLTLLAVTGLTD